MIKYVESAARLLNRNCVNKGGLDLGLGLGQRAAELRAVKVGGQKKNSADRPGAGETGSNQANWQNLFFDLQL